MFVIYYVIYDIIKIVNFETFCFQYVADYLSVVKQNSYPDGSLKLAFGRDVPLQSFKIDLYTNVYQFLKKSDPFKYQSKPKYAKF